MGPRHLTATGSRVWFVSTVIIAQKDRLITWYYVKVLGHWSIIITITQIMAIQGDNRRPYIITFCRLWKCFTEHLYTKIAQNDRVIPCYSVSIVTGEDIPFDRYTHFNLSTHFPPISKRTFHIVLSRKILNRHMLHSSSLSVE